MDPTTVQIGFMLAGVLGFGAGVFVGGVSTHATESAFRRYLVGKKVRAALDIDERDRAHRRPLSRVGVSWDD